ncbi:Outer membrane receptor protein [Ignavibacterium album JCM 16511]|uniref:Outer membrane receptor protein n=1 Tax=Ignavibacterium album (strain DSM 19864 / JCM 16511 / NBRC 101810 / Mat9-16) TaxID=945713 RepID=I0AJR0_IGNAJ|nr:TonB-dependent receptor [Ignavibacterium album]AFH49217.1 Outer membrane receptor protein [Ignavibacterium album JCM 16511]
MFHKTKISIVCQKFLIKVFLIFLLVYFPLHAQDKGSITGLVLDKETGDAIIGANVLIENSNIGAATDIEGKFRIENVNPGKYNVIVSYISYSKIIIKDVEVTAGKSTELKVALTSEAISVDEVVVVDKLDRSYENALINQRKKSNSISDGISSEQIKKSNDASTSDALKRIPGVTLLDNKFIFVRGTSERYSNAQLNNTSLSSTEPEKKSFAFDLLPTNLLSNTIVVKSFTPDISGDFAGGTVQINTVDFPDKLKINLSYSTSYTSNTSFKDFSTYSGGGNFWGFDNGTRALPSSFPANLGSAGLTRAEINELAKSLNNVWAPETKRAPLNNNFSVSIGDGTTLLGQNFGFVAAFSFRNSYKNSNVERNEFEASGEPRFAFKGNQSTYSTMMGGMLNLSYKLSDLHKFSLKNTYSRSSDDEVSVLSGAQFTDAGKEQIQTALRFVERDVLSSQLNGEHYFPFLNNIRMDWKTYYSQSNRNEPDYRRVLYGRDIGTNDPYAAILGFQPNLKNGGRYFSNLFDKTRGASIDLTIPTSYAKYKFGSSYEEKKRDFTSRLISVIINASGNGFTDFNLLYLPLNEIFAPENFRRNGFSIEEYQNGSNNYFAKQDVFSSYVMIEFPFYFLDQEFSFIGGARLENSLQQINSFDLSGQIPLSNQLKKVDILPSANLIYRISPITNLRLGYSQTVNRPELRELASFAYFDYATQTSVRGNPNLQRALIRNYDLRFEIFPGVGELISASIFYKSISDAIEKVVVTGSALGSERTFTNSDKAKIYGFELEGRFTLGFLGSYFNNFSLNGNYSWIKSAVTVKGTETTIPREERPLQGQSPYVLNFGLYLTEPTIGTTLGILYNRIGERIVEVATAYEEDVIEQPRDLLDFFISQPFFENFEIKLGIKDLLSQEQVFTQGDKKSRVNSSNTGISLGLSYKIQ